VKEAVAFLRTNGFPARQDAHDNFLTYLARIQDDPQYPAALRESAKEMEPTLALIEQVGIIRCVIRTHRFN
jgi:hypothetical protein